MFYVLMPRLYRLYIFAALAVVVQVNAKICGLLENGGEVILGIYKILAFTCTTTASARKDIKMVQSRH